MESKAIAKYVRVSPRKADRVLRLIRGLQVDRAQEVLAFTTRPIAKQISKVLKSAVANATHRSEKAAEKERAAGKEKTARVAVEDLRVKLAVAGAAPTMKRFLPRAQGRATPLLKRSAHITIVLDDGKK
jgi:large subunit ribosomal protein L22